MKLNKKEIQLLDNSPTPHLLETALFDGSSISLAKVKILINGSSEPLDTKRALISHISGISEEGDKEATDKKVKKLLTKTTEWLGEFDELSNVSKVMVSANLETWVPDNTNPLTLLNRDMIMRNIILSFALLVELETVIPTFERSSGVPADQIGLVKNSFYGPLTDYSNRVTTTDIIYDTVKHLTSRYSYDQFALVKKLGADIKVDVISNFANNLRGKSQMVQISNLAFPVSMYSRPGVDINLKDITREIIEKKLEGLNLSLK